MLESWRVGELVGGFSGSEVQVGARCRLLQLVQGARCKVQIGAMGAIVAVVDAGFKFQVSSCRFTHNFIYFLN